MPRPTPVRQRGPNGRFLSSHASITTTTAQPSASLLSLPPELRLAIYRFLFRTTDKYTLHRLEDVISQRKAFAPGKIKLFNNSILTTCKKIHTEALPLFYASQVFHYTIDQSNFLAGPATTEAYLGRMKHLSIDITVSRQSFTELDTIISTHVNTKLKHHTNIRSLTLHIIPESEAGTLPSIITPTHTSLSFGQGAAATALKSLRSRIDRLSIVYFGGWHDLHNLREAVADDARWVEEGKCYGWPGLSLTEAQSTAVTAPQRRYTLVGSEGVNHPHSQCIRVFHT